MKRKNPYSLMDVKHITLEPIIAVRGGQAVCVGVDVGKAMLAVSLVWPDESFDRPWKVANPSQVRLLVSLLVKLHAHCPVTVAMESSGTYGDGLRQTLADAGIAVKRVASKSVKDSCEMFDGVPSQHDGKDAAIIGTLGRRGQAVAWPFVDRCDVDLAIRYQVRKLDAAQRVKQIWCGRQESLLARHWPEACRLLAPSGATLVRSMARWGDPRKLADDPQAAAVLAGFGGRYLLAGKIAAVVESASSSIGVRMNAWAVREMKETAEAILAQRAVILGCRRELRKLTRDHACIQSQASAVGLVTACVLWMCLGDPAHYDSGSAYRKAMGLNLKERSSGMLKGRLSISKRGQRLTRKWMYFSALRWMRDPGVKVWVERKKQRDGGRGGRAVVGVMRHLALAAWHTGQGEVFDVGRLFPGTKRKGVNSKGVKDAGGNKTCVNDERVTAAGGTKEALMK